MLSYGYGSSPPLWDLSVYGKSLILISSEQSEI